mmetsp:Transcript_29071/g.74178  ORF Transcript_29071/g.74178 Transcript_29071/m.74178 type:complete len:302 (+) Transcript_29071:1159-2064(+)
MRAAARRTSGSKSRRPRQCLAGRRRASLRPPRCPRCPRGWRPRSRWARRKPAGRCLQAAWGSTSCLATSLPSQCHHPWSRCLRTAHCQGGRRTPQQAARPSLPPPHPAQPPANRTGCRQGRWVSLPRPQRQWGRSRPPSTLAVHCTRLARALPARRVRSLVPRCQGCPSRCHLPRCPSSSSRWPRNSSFCASSVQRLPPSSCSRRCTTSRRSSRSTTTQAAAPRYHPRHPRWRQCHRQWEGSITRTHQPCRLEGLVCQPPRCRCRATLGVHPAARSAQAVRASRLRTRGTSPWVRRPSLMT